MYISNYLFAKKINIVQYNNSQEIHIKNIWIAR